MTLLESFLVALGAFFAGGMNALAGGGTFFSFPAMLAAGVPPVMANASNTVALWPASLAGAWAYRKEALRHGRWAMVLVGVMLAGGLAGSLLLLAVSNAVFSRLIPWLLLVATALFATSAYVNRLVVWLKGKLGLTVADGPNVSAGGVLFQLGVGVYGGFFGAGMGILTLAALSIQGYEDMQELNALKNLTSAVNYSIAAITFLIAGAISWPHTLVALGFATLGGMAGAALAKRLPSRWLRRLVIAVGASLTAIYFVKSV